MEQDAEVSVAAKGAGKDEKKDVYTYTSKYPLYSIGWTCRPDRADRIAVGSIVEEYANKVCNLQPPSLVLCFGLALRQQQQHVFTYWRIEAL